MTGFTGCKIGFTGFKIRKYPVNPVKDKIEKLNREDK